MDTVPVKPVGVYRMGEADHRFPPRALSLNNGKISRDYTKMCIETKKCGEAVSISFIGGTRKIGISCCYTDNCTPSLPKLPSNSPKANGLTCPTCRDKESTYCEPQTNIKCSGDERMCIRHDTSIPTGGDSMKGCSTPNVCVIYFKIAYRYDNDYLDQYFSCDPGIPTGNEVSLSCFQCAKTNSNCQGFKVTCPADHSCGLIYKEMTEDGQVNTEYIKSCMPKEKCNTIGSITHAHGEIKIGISCCDTDSCTPSLPQWPADSSNANGLSCPTCRDLKNSKCNPESELQCTGSKTVCVNQTTEKTGFKESAMGCATPSICDIKSYSYKNDLSFINMDFSCNNKNGNPNDQPSTGTSLMCVICKSDDSLECEGVLEFCQANYVCASSYRITTSAKNQIYSITRSCLPEDKCHLFGTMSMTGKRNVIGTSCCKEDGCTPPIAPWKSKLEKSNGVKCKTCVSTESDTCESADTLGCRGDENQCVNYALTVTSEFDSAAFSFSGCGSKALCDAKKYLMFIDNVEYEHRFTCA